ncbi:uncharacterized protein METZ01_LOCUS158659, partial [marine metagenome]
VKVDRYTRITLTVIALSLSTLAINYIVAPQPATAAAPAEGGGRYQLVIGESSIVVIDTTSGTLYYANNVFSTTKRATFLNTETGYPRVTR